MIKDSQKLLLFVLAIVVIYIGSTYAVTPQYVFDLNCQDSDGGMNFYEAGSATWEYEGESFVDNDYCDSPDLLAEYYCEGGAQGGQSVLEYVECFEGCSNGACVRDSTPTPPPGCTDTYYAPVDVSQLFQLKRLPTNTRVGVEYHVGARQCTEVINQNVELLYVERTSPLAQALLESAEDIEHLFAIAGPEQFREIQSCQSDRTQAFKISVPYRGTVRDSYDVFFANPETPATTGEYILVAGVYEECGDPYVNFAVVDNIMIASSVPASDEDCDSKYDEDFDGVTGVRDTDCQGQTDPDISGLCCIHNDGSYTKYHTDRDKCPYYEKPSDECPELTGEVTCIRSDQCATGQVCKNPGTTESRCAIWETDEITCSSDNDCAPTQTCTDSGTVNSRCEVIPTIDPGTTPGDEPEEITCNSDNDCAPEQVCKNPGAVSSFCERASTTPDPSSVTCYKDGDCATGQVCRYPGASSSFCELLDDDDGGDESFDLIQLIKDNQLIAGGIVVVFLLLLLMPKGRR